MKIADIPKISRLSTAEKILFVEELWDSISSGGRISIPEAHKAELDRRLAKYQNHSGHLLSLKELQARMENKLKKKKWTIPQLIVLVRGKSEEGVLLACKTTTCSGICSPGGKNVCCHKKPSGWCDACFADRCS